MQRYPFIYPLFILLVTNSFQYTHARNLNILSLRYLIIFLYKGKIPNARQSTSPFFLCCYMLLDSPLLRVTRPTSAWPASCFWRCTSSVTVPREMDGDVVCAWKNPAHGTSWTYPVRRDGSFNRRAEAMIRVVAVEASTYARAGWFSPSVTASNRSRAAQESKTRGNVVLKNNKWRTRKRQTCGETRQTIESDSRETAAREKMIRFLSSDFSVFGFEDELAWIGQSSNFSLRLLLKLGRKVRAQRTELLATSRFLSAELFATTELIRSKLPLPMFAPYCGRDKLSPNFLETNRKGKRNEQFSNLLPNTRSKLLISRLIFRIFTQIWNYCTLGSN